MSISFSATLSMADLPFLYQARFYGCIFLRQ
jgi:hypothetical protein